MIDPWPFDDPPSVATITSRGVVDGETPVLLVVRDADEGDWMFLDGGEWDSGEGRMVSLGSMIELDPTLAALASLPLGWEASRATVGGEWRISPCET